MLLQYGAIVVSHYNLNKRLNQSHNRVNMQKEERPSLQGLRHMMLDILKSKALNITPPKRYNHHTKVKCF